MTIAVALPALEGLSAVDQRGLSFTASRYYQGANHRAWFPVAEHMLKLDPACPDGPTAVSIAPLISILPGMRLHACRRCHLMLNDGGQNPALADDGLVHLVAIIAVEVLNHAGFRPSRGTFRRPILLEQQPIAEGVFVIAHEYTDEDMSERAVKYAVRAVAECVSGLSQTSHLADELEELVAYARRNRRIGPPTDEILCAAERRNIPWKLLKRQGRLLQLGHGSKRKLLDLTVTGNTSGNAVLIARNKHVANGLLRASLLPVPRHFAVSDEAEARVRAKEIGYPLVVKPLNGNKGKGVSVGVANETELESAFAKARGISREVLVEELLRGFDHRILVVNGEVVAVARRLPAQVIGDGTSTLAKLVERENAGRIGSPHARLLVPLKLDRESERTLSRQHLNSEQVPEQGRVVFLRTVANWSQGGTAVDVTDEIHPENRDMAIRAADAVGLDIAGVDFITPDIARPCREVSGGIVEVNYRPGLLVHLSAMGDRRVDLGGPIIDGLFAAGDDGRIPVILVIEDEDSGCVEILANILAAGGRNVGYFRNGHIRHTSDGISVHAVEWRAAMHILLEDPAADAAVIQIPAKQALQCGLQMEQWSAAVMVPGADAGTENGILRSETLPRGSGGIALPAGAISRSKDRTNGNAWFFAETMSDALAAEITAGAKVVVAGADGATVEFWRSGSLLASRCVSAWQDSATSEEISVRGILAATAAALAAGEDIAAICKVIDQGPVAGTIADAASLVANRKGRLESLRSIVQIADYLKVPVQSRCEWNDSDEIQIGLGARQGRFRRAKTDKTAHLSTEIADSKSWTNRLLRTHGLPVAMQATASSEREALAAARRIGFPVIVKPVDSSESQGVTGNIRSEAELRSAVRLARRISRTVIVEQFVSGDDHRLIVIGGKVIHATRHLPAHIVGDGAHTIAELVAIENRNPNRGPERHKPLEFIELDWDSERVLTSAGLSSASVPSAGQFVRLKSIANLSTGGTAIDVTRSVHPANIEAAERVAKLVNLNICGIDFLTPDITRSYHDVAAIICEVNQRPAFDGHDVATNWRNGVRGAIFSEFCPKLSPSRLPVAVYASDGPSATQSATVLRHLLVHSGRRVGYFSSGLRQAGVGLYPMHFDTSDQSDLIAAVLNDRRAEAAVISAPGTELFARPELLTGAVVVCGPEGQRLRAPEMYSKMIAGASAVVADADDRELAETVEDAEDALYYRYGAAPPAATTTMPRPSCDAYWSDESDRARLLLIAAAGSHVVLEAGDGVMRHLSRGIAAQAAATASALGLSPAEIERGFSALLPDPLKLASAIEVVTGLPFSLAIGINHHDFSQEAAIGFRDAAAVTGRRILVVAGPTDVAVRLAATVADFFDQFYCTGDPMGRALFAALLAQGIRPAAIATAHDERTLVASALAAARPGDHVVCLVGNPEGCRSLARGMGVRR